MMLDINMELTGPIFINEDAKDERLEILNSLLLRVGDDQREVVEHEIKLIELGAMGEANVMYELRHTREKLLILHDITIKDSVNDSQIDFLIITRCGIIVLETKRLVGDIEINSDGDFIRHYKNAEGKVYKKEGIYSPITQNKYHIDAILDLLSNNNIISDIPCYSLVVIANPKTIIDKTYAKPDIKEQIIKYDQLNENIKAIIKAHGGEYNISDRKMVEIAQFISKANEPREYDYIKRLKLIIPDEVEAENVKIIDGMSEKSHKDDKLYEALKKYRINKASELNYKIYMIFTNKELEQIVLNRPKAKEELLKLPGWGEKKYKLYGEDIIKLVLNDSMPHEECNPFSDERNRALYNSLKKLRYTISKEQNIKPYMIFTNSQIEEIIRRKPKSLAELLSCDGIGEAKCDKYGKEILAIINNRY